jgi:uncharacterized surface protein with fasciclin (FAS1) repeats
MENGSKSAIIIAVVALLAIGGGTAFLLTRNNDTKEETTKTTQSSQETTKVSEPTQNIVEVAVGNPDFSTLVTALKAADLVTALSDETKSYTVFAPTNAAFNKLPAGTVETLLKPENKSTLSGILTYHVVDSAVLSSQLSNGQVIKTLNGGKLTVEISGGMVYLVDAKGGKAKVTTADVKTTNGVIHIIDAVVLPS